MTLTHYYDTNNQKTLTHETVDKIFHPEGDTSMIETLARQRALEEVWKLWLEEYEDDHFNLPYDECQKVVEKIAKEQFQLFSSMKKHL